jgi:DNA-directed RNA polymerase subunit beta'
MSHEDLVGMNEQHSVRIALASPEDVLAWSHGEVVNGETINYRTGRPVAGGLFCERIFGPERDWQCGCGKYRGLKHKGARCDKCGVQVAHSRGRRHRMGHIELACPVVHVWFFKLRPSILAHLLDLKSAVLERIIYQQDRVVMAPGNTPLKRMQVLSDEAYSAARAEHGSDFEAATGAEAIATLLRELDLCALARDLRRQLRDLMRKDKVPVERQRKLVRRCRIVEGLLRGGNRPEWMVLRRIPVIPPDLRPLALLESGNYATSDLNDLYRRILQRNARLKKLLDLNAPEVIVRNEKRLLQQAVDALFDNERANRPVVGAAGRPLRSLADMIKGKQGRFRQNLLGKRVDYSARSVIVVGPELKLHQCGLPKAIALELFQPFVIGRLLRTGAATSIHKARRLVRERANGVWDALASVMEGQHVLLNRAPTLHRMGIQAFEPVLIEGNAIRLHPLVCKAFNADFDGDQMAVHLPLSIEARAEAASLMTPANNVFSPANGQPIITPSKDMVLGCYYLTLTDDKGNGARPVLTASPEEVIQAHAVGKIDTHAFVQVRLPLGQEVVSEGGASSCRLVTTVGRVLFNDNLPAGMPFYDLELTAKNLSRIIADCRQRLGQEKTIALLERIKDVGFRAATRSGISIAVSDLRCPADKERVIAQTERAVEKVRAIYQRGDMAEDDRREKVIDLWLRATASVREGVMRELATAGDGKEPLSPVHVMVRSGARGSPEQLGQLAGMRGLMARPSGEVLEVPIKSSFREGLSVLEYFSSTHGARKGLVDLALKTADSGYLTRKLVDVAQGVIVTTHDCCTPEGVRRGPSAGAILGRVAMETVIHPLTDEPIVRAGEMIGPEAARAIEALNGPDVLVRSVMLCEAERGVCRLCYGMDRATGRLVDLGQAVGVIAAQSIGEPATQLTMRTFQTGGVASTHDITTGLQRVIELFEAQEGQRPAVLAELAGEVRVGEVQERQRGRRVVFVRAVNEQGRPVGVEKGHALPRGAELLVRTGDRVELGQALTDGPVSPHDLLRVLGAPVVRQHLLSEIQEVYRQQGIDLDDKHIEIVLGRMLAWARVRDMGDSDLLPGALIERVALRKINRGLKRPATVVPELLGASAAALQAASFLSAASFQETTKVLTEAALAGKVDYLVGLKENVLLGKLVPAGTGFRPGAEGGRA